MADASAAKCSAQAEQRGHPVSVARMMGLETAAVILGGVDQLASALGITPRAARYKLTGDRGVSSGDLLLVASALETRAIRILDHASKLRLEAGVS